MESKWTKAKKALGLNLCIYAPNNLEDASPSDEFPDRSSVSFSAAKFPATSGSTNLSKSESRSFKKTCAICLGGMKPGQGHALFTAECSHTFHFNCITSNVKHGNHVCPVCRAKWKEIPFQGPSLPDHSHARTRVNPVNFPHDDAIMTILRHQPRPHQTRHIFQRPEPTVFDDDEPLDHLPSETTSDASHRCNETVDIKTYPEFSAVAQSISEENFTVLLHLKAPVSGRAQSTRAPIDLVTVLDVSGSMSGTKLALLKRAMGFVIQNLSPSDRLSVVTFSTYTNRLFHLRRMSESGRQLALQAVNSLTCHGGTNIAGGLKKGAKVIDHRKHKNPVCSIILLSDGQDTHPSGPFHSSYNLTSIPVHSFGFGDDHDSVTMHTISEKSGGTFSYIEAESAIQDAFAQCIGGLLSVVVQELDVEIDSAHPGVTLSAIKSGSYTSKLSEDRLLGSIRVGDLYADEERDFLVCVSIPRAIGEMSTPLLRVGCVYRDPVSNKTLQVEGEEVVIQRPTSITERTVSIEVDRERNRVQAAEAMAEAKAAADRGALSDAATLLETRRRLLSQSDASRAGDRLCVSLDAELKEIQERMASQHQYDVSGRAYVLSGLSSHSWQRATARGDSTHGTSLVQAYQTPSMVEMLQRSQTLGPPLRQQLVLQPIQPSKSFNLRPRDS